MNNLAVSYVNIGSIAKALDLGEETLERRRKVLGAGHPDTLMSMNNQANFLQYAGHLEDAVALAEQTFDLCNGQLGAKHRETSEIAA